MVIFETFARYNSERKCILIAWLKSFKNHTGTCVSFRNVCHFNYLNKETF